MYELPTVSNARETVRVEESYPGAQIKRRLRRSHSPEGRDLRGNRIVDLQQVLLEAEVFVNPNT